MNLVSFIFVLIFNYNYIVESKNFNVGNECTDEGSREFLTCDSFLECENGKFSTKYCEFGQKYDYERNECSSDITLNGLCTSESSDCNFNGNKPVKGSRSKYIYCENGKLVYGECNEYFDRFTKRCNSIGSTNNVQKYESVSFLLDDTDCVPDKKIPVKNSCSEYMECDSIAGWVLHECQDCQHFDPTSMRCVWAWKYYCDFGSTTYFPYTTDEPTTGQPITSSSIDPTSDSTTGTNEYSSTSLDPTTGTSSYDPTTGTATSQEPFSTVTSSSTETTVTSSNDEPTSSRQPTSATSKHPTTTKLSTTTAITTTSEPSKSTTATTKSSTTTQQTTASPSTKKSTTTTTKPSSSTSPSTTTKKPECDKEGEKKIFKKGDCKDYLECDSGEWVEKTCSWGFHFDINKLECRFSLWATC